MFQQRNSIIYLALLICLGVMTLVYFSSQYVLAYNSGARWVETAGFPPRVPYQLDSNNDSRLGISGSASHLNVSAGWWHLASRFELYNSNGPNSQGNIVSTRNFITQPPCGAIDSFVAVSCLYATPTTMNRAEMYFNISPSYTWNTSGNLNCGSTPSPVDLQTVALHEFGHWHSLNHVTGVPVMNFDCTLKREPREDDKRGASQIYGPTTGFETVDLAGHTNDMDVWQKDVAGYFGTSNPPPELGPRTAEFGVPIEFGSRYEMMAGTAQSSYSYAYFRWITSADDISGNTNYIVIRPGMKLVWHQYNYQQKTMSIDFLMDDGNTLRDSCPGGNCIVDQNNVRVHPAARGGYPTGQWLYFEVNLSPLAGRKIMRWMLAFDNGSTGQTGQFRGYFDNLEIRY